MRAQYTRIIDSIYGPRLDFISGDATSAYDRTLGLQRYRRYLIFLKDYNMLIVLDDIALDKARPLELRFHPESREVSKDGNAFLLRGKNATLRIEPLITEGVTTTAEDLSGEGRHGENEFKMFTIRLATQRAQWRQATAFTWSKNGFAPSRVSLVNNGPICTITTGVNDINFDWERGTIISYGF